MSDRLAETILETLRQSLKLSMGVCLIQRPGIGDAWRIDATDANGERWVAEHEDYYSAAVMLAELVGFDLEE